MVPPPRHTLSANPYPGNVSAVGHIICRTIPLSDGSKALQNKSTLVDDGLNKYHGSHLRFLFHDSLSDNRIIVVFSVSCQCLVQFFLPIYFIEAPNLLALADPTGSIRAPISSTFKRIRNHCMITTSEQLTAICSDWVGSFKLAEAVGFEPT